MSDSNTNKEEAQEVDLGLAGKMAKSFIHSPLSPLLLVAMLGLGMMGLILTPRQEDPQISVPMVDILVQYPGATAEQVETLVANPLEILMSDITGVKHVYSASMRGAAMVTVQFKVGENMEESLVKLNDKIFSNYDKIPPGVSKPLIKPKAVDDVPVVTLTLWSDDIDDSALRLLGLDLLQRLKEVRNTSKSFLVGGRAQQIKVEALAEKLAGYGISLGQLAQTIQTANSERGVGRMESNNKAFKVFTGAFLKNADDIASLLVGTFNDAPVYVRDVADVSHEPEDAKQLVEYYTGPAYAGENRSEFSSSGSPSVTVAVAKKYGSNGVAVADDVLAKVESLKGVLIPENVHVEITRNYGQTANEKVNGLILKLFVATGVVTVLVWWALGVRAAAVVLIVIPVVILFTVFGAFVMGFTIDRVSLFALIFSIGILVDDAIVVVENIYRRWLMKGSTDTDTSIDAVREVGNPTILATFTVIAALLPMGFVSGMMGPYMAPIPALGSVAMLFSLFAAFIFTPWLVMRLKPSLTYLRKAEAAEHRFDERMQKLYNLILLPLINSKTKGWLFLISVILVFFLCCFLFYTTAVTAKMLPLDNKPEFNVQINMQEGTALPITANFAKQLAVELQKIEQVTALQTYTGTASPFNFNGLVRHSYLRNNPWQADIQVQLTHKSERKLSSHDLAVQARKILTPLAEREGVNIEVVEMPPGPPVLQSVVAEVYGPDANTRRIVATDLTEIFRSVDGLTDVDNLIQQPYEVWRFVVDTEKAVRQGVSVDTINRNLEMGLGEFVLGDIKEGNVSEPTYIVMQVPMEERANFAQINNLPIMSSKGFSVPLSELGRFERDDMGNAIFHKDLRPVEFVTAEVQGRLASPIYGMMDVEKKLEDYVTPDGVKLESEYLGPPDTSFKSGFEWTGEWTVTYETFRDMGIAFGAAIILIYMLVVWEFGNFIVPAIVISPIPLTLIGIIPGHWLMGAEFTATSMIGFIALAGIIVRNSILLVDFARHEIAAGVDPLDAIVGSCRARTRPILITAGALMGGAMVILSDPIFKGMAVSLFFGVLVATLLTLLVIPLGCMSARAAVAGGDGFGDDEIDLDAQNSADIVQQDSSSGNVITGLLGGIGVLISLVFQIIGRLLQVIFNIISFFSGLFKRNETPVTATAVTDSETQKTTPAEPEPVVESILEAETSPSDTDSGTKLDESVEVFTIEPELTEEKPDTTKVESDDISESTKPKKEKGSAKNKSANKKPKKSSSSTKVKRKTFKISRKNANNRRRIGHSPDDEGSTE